MLPETKLLSPSVVWKHVRDNLNMLQQLYCCNWQTLPLLERQKQQNVVAIDWKYGTKFIWDTMFHGMSCIRQSFNLAQIIGWEKCFACFKMFKKLFTVPATHLFPYPRCLRGMHAVTCETITYIWRFSAAPHPSCQVTALDVSEVRLFMGLWQEWEDLKDPGFTSSHWGKDQHSGTYTYNRLWI